MSNDRLSEKLRLFAKDWTVAELYLPKEVREQTLRDAADKLDRLQDALSEVAVQWSESLSGRSSGFTCQLCGEYANSLEELKHNSLCLMSEE